MFIANYFFHMPKQLIVIQHKGSTLLQVGELMLYEIYRSKTKSVMSKHFCLTKAAHKV